MSSFCLRTFWVFFFAQLLYAQQTRRENIQLSKSEISLFTFSVANHQNIFTSLQWVVNMCLAELEQTSSIKFRVFLCYLQRKKAERRAVFSSFTIHSQKNDMRPRARVLNVFLCSKWMENRTKTPPPLCTRLLFHWSLADNGNIASHEEVYQKALFLLACYKYWNRMKRKPAVALMIRVKLFVHTKHEAPESDLIILYSAREALCDNMPWQFACL